MCENLPALGAKLCSSLVKMLSNIKHPHGNPTKHDVLLLIRCLFLEDCKAERCEVVGANPFMTASIVRSRHDAFWDPVYVIVNREVVAEVSAFNRLYTNMIRRRSPNFHGEVHCYCGMQASRKTGRRHDCPEGDGKDVCIPEAVILFVIRGEHAVNVFECFHLRTVVYGLVFVF